MTDQEPPRKQRLSAKRIFERLKKEHEFIGGYTIVKDAARLVSECDGLSEMRLNWFDKRKDHRRAYTPSYLSFE